MPQIGVFWYYKFAVFGRAVSLEMAKDYSIEVLDSPDAHSNLWDSDRNLLRDFPDLHGREYFSIPRGRVLWDPKASSAWILMDSVLFNGSIKQKILKFFDLETANVQWRRDCHYTTNTIDIDALFND